MKKILLLLNVFLLLLFCGCRKMDLTNPGSPPIISNSQSSPSFKDHVRIAVLSDIHYLDPTLLLNNAASGTDFINAKVGDPNKGLLEYSSAIFNKVASEILNQRPDILLISGDLAKAGEKIDHQAVAAILTQLKMAGIKIYVTIGNHDINDAGAKGYNGNGSFGVSTVTPIEFTTMYNDFGFGSAISKDASSLSYVAEPVPGLRILSIDAAKYAPTFSRTGKIKPETMAWIKQQLATASQNNILVLAMMHHNLVQHFNDQYIVTPGTTVDDWQARADSLISYGLKVIFTGHTHVYDITSRTYEGKTIYDIVTGSPLTTPSGFRIIDLKNKEMEVTTHHLDAIDASYPGKFSDFEQQALRDNLDAYFGPKLTGAPYSLSPSVASYAVPLMRNAYMAHIAGDEKISPAEQARIDSLKLVTPYPAYSINAITQLWTDLNTRDNKWHVKLMDGVN